LVFVRGKFRIATEGFNITLGGTLPSITTYIETCSTHWSFSGIDLSTTSARDAFFKPTPGCACAFNNTASIKVTSEITPLGITNYAPSIWSNVISLPPEDFHNLCKDSTVPLIDVRNHYESRIGHFVTGTGDAAVRPAVRRFSQWPGYVMRHVLGNEMFKGPVATYCTGGIRCEKGARWMQEALAAEGDRGDVPVYTLHGGIVAYQAWMQEEVAAGKKRPEESFFKGKNYVFDARGAIGAVGDTVSMCHVCGEAEDRLGKCEGDRCHLVLVVCEDCERKGGVRCCDDCAHIDISQSLDAAEKAKRMCRCESDREKSLWGDEGAKIRKVKPRQKTIRTANR
jgi:predicted sulfurtransferase